MMRAVNLLRLDGREIFRSVWETTYADSDLKFPKPGAVNRCTVKLADTPEADRLFGYLVHKFV